MAVPIPWVKTQFLDANGDPLAGGKVYTFEAGTSTPKVSYTDQTAGTPNANPVILDAAGRADIWLQGSAYKIRVDDADDTTLYTVDNIPATSVFAGSPVSTRQTANATLACTDNASVLTASSIVPANARLCNVYVHNVVAPGTSKSLSGYDVGSHGVQDRWGANVALTLDKKTTQGDHTLSEEPKSASAQDVSIYSRGGTFDGTGSIYVLAEYETGQVP